MLIYFSGILGVLTKKPSVTWGEEQMPFQGLEITRAKLGYFIEKGAFSVGHPAFFGFRRYFLSKRAQ